MTLIDLAVDANGKRYTEHAFAFEGEPWRGAIILTPSVIRDLKSQGLLPLIEVPVEPRKSRTEIRGPR